MTKTSRDCLHQGHVWLEADSGKLFVRHRARPRGLVSVYCVFCPAVAEIEGFSATTAPPLPGAIPPLAQVPK